MSAPLSDEALNQLFRTARTQRSWRSEDVPERLIGELYDLLKLGPTASNICPARVLFIRSAGAKARLEPYLDPSNRTAVRQAPWTAIIAYDLAFTDHLAHLIPHAPQAATWFTEPHQREWNAIQSGTLQAAYLIMAARALGLDCGPMSGFSRQGVDAEFFSCDPAMASWRSNFLVNIGYGEEARVRARAPRLDFEDACRIA